MPGLTLPRWTLQNCAPGRIWPTWVTACATGSSSCVRTPSKTAPAGSPPAPPRVRVPNTPGGDVGCCPCGGREPRASSCPAALERSVAATCKEAVGWMFARLDTSGDLFLEAAELAAINLDKYEVCIRAFFNSCDTSKDGRVSAPEWCFCFWRESASEQGGAALWGPGVRRMHPSGLGAPCPEGCMPWIGVVHSWGWGMCMVGLELGMCFMGS